MLRWQERFSEFVLIREQTFMSLLLTDDIHMWLIQHGLSKESNARVSLQSSHPVGRGDAPEYWCPYTHWNATMY